MPISLATRFLEPKVLRAIAGIELKARLLVEGMYASRHRCPFYGYSVEFVDHREYSRGDEPRSIDWKMLGRTEKYFVKRFEMESNMNVVCLLDVSASMGYKGTDSARLAKMEYACYLAASLAYLVRHQQDSSGLVAFDSGIREFFPPRQGQRHMFSILSRLDAIKAGGGTNISSVLKLVSQRLNRRGIVVLISDCYGESDEVIDGIRHLRARGQEVILFHVMDHDEIVFPFNALTAFRDLETSAQIMCDPLRQKNLYTKRFEAFRESIKTGCATSGADYRFIDTVEPIEIVLRDFLLFRQRRR